MSGCPLLSIRELAEAYVEGDDPLEIVADDEPAIRTFPCLNPLTTKRFAEPAEVQSTLF